MAEGQGWHSSGTLGETNGFSCMCFVEMRVNQVGTSIPRVFVHDVIASKVIPFFRGFLKGRLTKHVTFSLICDQF